MMEELDKYAIYILFIVLVTLVRFTLKGVRVDNEEVIKRVAEEVSKKLVDQFAEMFKITINAHQQAEVRERKLRSDFNKQDDDIKDDISQIKSRVRELEENSLSKTEARKKYQEK